MLEIQINLNTDAVLEVFLVGEVVNRALRQGIALVFGHVELEVKHRADKVQQDQNRNEHA